MHYNRLADFREQLVASFLQAGDTLLNLVDALAAETPTHSLAELSLSPFFPRQWGSLYQGLQRARIDRASLRKLFASVVSAPEPATRLVLGIDASSILRPCSNECQRSCRRSDLCKGEPTRSDQDGGDAGPNRVPSPSGNDGRTLTRYRKRPFS